MNTEYASLVEIGTPKIKWEWDVFGGSLLMVQIDFEVPLWRRILTKILLGSKWKKQKERK